ncbi:SusC/RagA family TonB-linked outer membrane protein [Pedobacter montanisoli]|uniref:SusC/RagA family TonB-linked outer membrane protein n=1 Tax=Pedobacter montanisoli TaxID=2923277 RepID=A0ABS9ZTB8_9SPHI|nr:SusC/RagA family TonB-linked outer membrane protein [Pedobacter montanisoli]MCJ0741850.1 SusC/RagA family TonB-linked outer membrane protein [Pedobacter montanisoli]
MRKLLMVWCCCCLYFGAQAQYGIKLRDAETNMPIHTATLKLLGANKILPSNANGEITLDGLSGRQRVSVAAMGYQTDTLMLNLPFTQWLLHQLKPVATQLNEVIVNTGYQQLPKERATGSFSVVNNKTFNEQQGVDVLSRLEGITPALSVDRRTYAGSIMVRGLSTINGDRSPLIVVDDFPYAGELSNLNPNDVESVTVLKDAAAASIWGAQAGNGVIVITTKKGRFNQTMQINVSTGLLLNQKPKLANYNNLSSAEMIEVEQFLFGKGFYNTQENSTARIPLSPVVELLIANRDGQLGAAELSDRLRMLSEKDIVQEYRNHFYGQPWLQQYHLDISGGNALSKWYLFTGYNQGKDALGAYSDRLNLKSDYTFKLGKKMELTAAAWLTLQNNQSGRLDFSQLTTSNGLLPPYTTFTDADGNALSIMKNYRESYTAQLGQGKLLDWKYYPLNEGNEVLSTGKQMDALFNFKLSYQLSSGLQFTANYSTQVARNITGTDYGAQSYYVRNLINQFTQLNGNEVKRTIPLGGISQESRVLLNNQNLRTQLNFKQRWAAFDLNILVGAEMRSTKRNTKSNGMYGIDRETLLSSPVDYQNAYTNIINGNSQFIPYLADAFGEVNNYISAYTNGALSYQGKYTLSGSVRRDASNLFGVATNNLWNPLWSLGVSWLATEEKWLRWQPLGYLRLRLTYGSSGNSDSRNAALTTITYTGVSNFTGTPTAGYNNYANPDLRWETVNTLNAGLDSKWFNGRLALSLEYYRKRSYDLIASDPIDYTGGVGSRTRRNAAQITASGIDVELATQNTLGVVKWNSSLFANFYKDRVDTYYLNSLTGSNFVNGSNVVTAVVGMPVYGAYGYRWGGLNPQTGSSRGYVDGVLSEDYATLIGSRTTIHDLAYVGPVLPKLTGAFANTLSYNGFNLSFRFSYKFGHYYRRPSLNYSDLYNSRNGNREFTQRWQQSGDEAFTNVPSMVYPIAGNRNSFYNFSEATLVSGDHIRLQNISLSYAFAKQQWKKLPFQQLTVTGNLNQAGLVWKRNNESHDPDYPYSEALKMYSINVQIKF